MNQRYACCEPRRLAAVRAGGVLNGIEYVEVSDAEAPTEDLRQRTLFVRMLDPDPGLTAANVTITGGDRIPELDVAWAAPATALPDGEDPALVADLRTPETVLVVRTTGRGDFSTYTLSLVAGAATDVPPAGWDPLLASVPFSFKVECTADADCRVHHVCPPPIAALPEIDYLAKDWEAFRRLILDRISLLAPEWRERNPADLGVVLVELLAWLGDELSWRQDAAAAEAWLGTARRRTSLRRHARLVDYRIGEGANARAWVQFAVTGEGAKVPAGTALLTRVPRIPPVVEDGGPEHRSALAAGAETFETMHDLVAYASHDTFELWTWGDADCCLPVGATRATIVGHHPTLKAGDVLVLAEVIGPRTGQPEDADPARRTAVRLTSVVSSSDPSGGRFETPPSNAALDVTEIAWDEADALDLPLCISVSDHPGLPVTRAFGNIVLADHGRTVADEDLGVVGEPILAVAADEGSHCEAATSTPVPVRYRPRLAERPMTHTGRPPVEVVAQRVAPPDVAADLAALTYGVALQAWLGALGFSFSAGPAIVRGGDGVWSVSDGATVVLLAEDAGTLSVAGRPAAAGESLAPTGRMATPAIEASATAITGTTVWRPRHDLLASSGDARDFVVEVEHDGAATLRFGDGVHGRRPDPGTSFTASYRVGNGPTGNIGADALAHVVSSSAAITGVRNRLSARGGIAPEAPAAIRRDAPEAFYVQERAVTAQDYADKAGQHREVQRAAATFRWTGSWHTVFVTADRLGGGDIGPAFGTKLRGHLEPYRMAGYDLAVDGPRFVALDLGLHVCAEAEHFRAHVRAAVLDLLSSGRRTDGRLGLFHPDRFTFGQPVHLSAVVAATQAVPGVQSVTVTRFGRLREPEVSAIDDGVIELGRLEIARLAADPNFPERGRLVVVMGGGK